MERKPHFYVSVKNFFTWVMVLCMVGSVVTRFIFPGEKGIGVWDQIVLPVAACVLFALITVFNGKERVVSNVEINVVSSAPIGNYNIADSKVFLHGKSYSVILVGVIGPTEFDSLTAVKVGSNGCREGSVKHLIVNAVYNFIKYRKQKKIRSQLMVLIFSSK